MDRTTRTLFCAALLLGAVGCTASVTDPSQSHDLAGPAFETDGVAAAADVLPTFSACKDGVCDGPLYSVVLAAEGTAIPVRAQAGDGSEIVAALEATASEVPGTGNWAIVDGVRWVEIWAGEVRGWVSSVHLTELVEPGRFAQDVYAHDLLDELRTSLEEGDGERLFSLVSPRHGLRVHALRDAAPVFYRDAQMRDVLASDQPQTWGVDPNSGQPIVGTFRDVVAGDLESVLVDPSRIAANSIPTGGATYDVAVPAEYANANFFAVHQARGEDGFDWTTWIVGVEYVEGQPYVFYLYRLGREI